MTMAVTGATGQLGRLVIENLKERVDAREIIALARTPFESQTSIDRRHPCRQRPQSDFISMAVTHEPEKAR